MRRVHLPTLAMCLLPLLAWDAIPAGAQASPAPLASVQLSYKFTPGQTLKYRIVQHVVGSRTMSGAKGSPSIDVELTSMIRMKCVQVLAGGIFEVSVDTESQSLKIAGKTVYGYAPSSESRSFQMTPSGKVTRTSPTSQSRTGFDFSSVESIIQMAIMPESPIVPGVTWSAELPMPTDPTASLKLAFTLQQLRQTGGFAAAVIQEVLSTNPGTTGPASSERPTASQNGQMDLVFDATRGQLASAKGTIRSHFATPVDVPAVPGASPGGKQLLTMDLNSSVTVEIQPETPLR